MLSGNASTKLPILAALLLVGACSAWRCPAPPTERPFFQVNHFSGGDAPVVYALEVYEDGLVRLNKVGFRAFCSRLEQGQLSQLQVLVESKRLNEAEWSPQAGMDWRMAQIQTGSAELRIVLEDPPQELRPLLSLIDALFKEHFGRRYDMALLSN